MSSSKIEGIAKTAYGIFTFLTAVASIVSIFNDANDDEFLADALFRHLANDPGNIFENNPFEPEDNQLSTYLSRPQ